MFVPKTLHSLMIAKAPGGDSSKGLHDGGGREAQLEDKGCLGAWNRVMVGENQTFHCVTLVLELHQPSGTSLRFGWEDFYSQRSLATVALEDLSDLILSDARGSVEEVENLCWALNAVLGGSLRVGEAVVAVAHEVLEGRGGVRKVMGVRHVLQERLLGMTEAQFTAEEEAVVEILDGALH
eukprot:GHVL01033104.1.p2 GENE.GHVL01033104.1~~GHVL01033104.1.p2  ORF type:complete len:181 (+),score=22.96 GHVL01033104.1:329-871(+)